MRSRPVPVVGEFYLGHPITHKYYSSKNKKHPNSINRPTPKLWLLNRWTKQVCKHGRASCQTVEGREWWSFDWDWDANRRGGYLVISNYNNIR